MVAARHGGAVHVHRRNCVRSGDDDPAVTRLGPLPRRVAGHLSDVPGPVKVVVPCRSPTEAADVRSTLVLVPPSLPRSCAAPRNSVLAEDLGHRARVAGSGRDGEVIHAATVAGPALPCDRRAGRTGWVLWVPAWLGLAGLSSALMIRDAATMPTMVAATPMPVARHGRRVRPEAGEPVSPSTRSWTRPQRLVRVRGEVFVRRRTSRAGADRCSSVLLDGVGAQVRCVRRQRPAAACQRAVGVAAHRARGAAEYVGDLGVREALVEAQDQDRPLLRGASCAEAVPEVVCPAARSVGRLGHAGAAGRPIGDSSVAKMWRTCHRRFHDRNSWVTIRVT